MASADRRSDSAGGVARVHLSRDSHRRTIRTARYRRHHSLPVGGVHAPHSGGGPIAILEPISLFRDAARCRRADDRLLPPGRVVAVAEARGVSLVAGRVTYVGWRRGDAFPRTRHRHQLVGECGGGGGSRAGRNERGAASQRSPARHQWDRMVALGARVVDPGGSSRTARSITSPGAGDDASVFCPGTRKAVFTSARSSAFTFCSLSGGPTAP